MILRALEQAISEVNAEFCNFHVLFPWFIDFFCLPEFFLRSFTFHNALADIFCDFNDLLVMLELILIL